MSRRKKALLSLAGSGDDGSTGLLGGGRVRKDHPRIEAYGTVDEASSAIGLAKALATDPRVKEICEEVQRDLYRIGAELATEPELAGKFARTAPADVARLERISTELEAGAPMPAGFVLPGGTPASGALDLARTIVRRAERRCLALGDSYADARRFLNRLSLLLFILGRFDEHRAGLAPRLAREARPPDA